MMTLRLRHSGLTWQVAGTDVVVLDLEDSVYLKLNDAGRFLWDRLATGCHETDLTDALVDEYGIDRELAARDVVNFLDDLRARNLLESE